MAVGGWRLVNITWIVSLQETYPSAGPSMLVYTPLALSGAFGAVLGSSVSISAKVPGA
jgi:hypothetical protein